MSLLLQIPKANTFSVMQPIETYRGVVYPQHIDHMGHMNVQWYTAKFDEATWHLCAHIGLTPAYLQSNTRGMVALEQHTKYLSEVSAGELLVVESQLQEVRDKTISFTHEMKMSVSGKAVATSRWVGLHINSELRRAHSLPDFVARWFAEYSDNRMIKP